MNHDHEEDDEEENDDDDDDDDDACDDDDDDDDDADDDDDDDGQFPQDGTQPSTRPSPTWEVVSSSVCGVFHQKPAGRHQAKGGLSLEKDDL